MAFRASDLTSFPRLLRTRSSWMRQPRCHLIRWKHYGCRVDAWHRWGTAFHRWHQVNLLLPRKFGGLIFNDYACLAKAPITASQDPMPSHVTLQAARSGIFATRMFINPAGARRCSSALCTAAPRGCGSRVSSRHRSSWHTKISKQQMVVAHSVNG